MMNSFASIDTWRESVKEKTLEEKHLEHYTKALSEISKKKEDKIALSDADRVVIRQAREFALKMQEKKEAERLVSTQTKELLDLLEKFAQESIALKVSLKEGAKVEKRDTFEKEDEQLINYLWLNKEELKDINIHSALDVVSKNKEMAFTSYEDWEKAWYVADWVFWPTELEQLNKLSSNSEVKEKLVRFKNMRDEMISLVDVIWTEEILKNTSEDDVLKVLFDRDNTGEIDSSDNKSILNLKNIYEFIAVKSQNPEDEKAILNNLWALIGKSYGSKKEIYDDLVQNPENKYLILKKITLLSWSKWGLLPTDYLLYGKEWAKKSLEKRDLVDKYLDEVMKKNEEKLLSKYNESLSDFVAKIPESDRDKYKEVIALMNSDTQKKSILDSFRMNGASILWSLVEWKKWAWIVTSFTNDDVNAYFKKVVDSVNFDVGFTYLGGTLVPWIWLSVDKKFDVTEETTLSAKLWFINVIPYAVFSWKTQLNAEDIKNQWFINLSTSPKYAGLAVNVSTLWAGAMLSYGKDRLKWVEAGEKLFSQFLDASINKNWTINEDVIKSQPDYEKNKSYYDNFVKHVNDYFSLTNYQSLPEKEQEKLLTSLKTSYRNIWKEWVLNDEARKWYEFSTVGVGIQFIAWFIPLPMVWVSFEKIGKNYRNDEVSRWYAVLWEVLVGGVAVAANARAWLVVATDKAEIEIDVIENKLDFGKNQKLFNRFAQRHPNDWKKLVAGNLEFNAKVAIVVKMLSEDRNKRSPFFTELRTEIVDLRKDIEGLKDKTDEKSKKELLDKQVQLNYLMAQFMVATFKDQRSVEEVVLGFTKDEKWNKTGNFDFVKPRVASMERFAKWSQLSSEFSKETKDIYWDIKADTLKWVSKKTPIEKLKIEQKPAPDLYWFVASYKIDDSWKSLWKGLVDVPAGQVTVLWWKERKIENEQDKTYVVSRFLETEYGKKVWIQLQNIINARNPDFNPSIDDIKKLLLTGKIEKDGRQVNLDTEFVYFLYGACANESMGIRIKNIEFLWGPIKDRWIVPFWDIWPDGLLTAKANTVNLIDATSSNLNIWLIAWKKDTQTTSWNNWNTPGWSSTTDWSWAWTAPENGVVAPNTWSTTVSTTGPWFQPPTP